MKMVRKLSLAAAIAGLVALPVWSVAGDAEEMDDDAAEMELDNSGEGNAEDAADMMDEADVDVDNSGQGNAEDAAEMDEDADKAAMADEVEEEEEEGVLEEVGDNIGDAFDRVF